MMQLGKEICNIDTCPNPSCSEKKACQRAATETNHQRDLSKTYLERLVEAFDQFDKADPATMYYNEEILWKRIKEEGLGSIRNLVDIANQIF